MENILSLIQHKGEDSNEVITHARGDIFAVAEKLQHWKNTGFNIENLELRDDDAHRKIQELTQALEFQQKRAEDFLHDLKVLNESLVQEADDRDWCDEYDKFAEEVNEKTRRFDLDTRETDIIIEMTVQVQVSARRGHESSLAEDVAGDICNYDYEVVSHDWEHC